MKSLLFLTLLISITSCGVTFRYATKLEAKKDSSFVYALPFPTGTKRLLVQGYNSFLSHKNKRALDFKMKTGSKVMAARSGVVSSIVANATNGGLKHKYLHMGNYVVIRHTDGTQAYYGHLQYNGALVQVGDSIAQGQLIALSGSTGYSAFPHLHFMVWGKSASGERKSVPTRFKTNKGIKYLKPGACYRAM